MDEKIAVMVFFLISFILSFYSLVDPNQNLLVLIWSFATPLMLGQLAYWIYENSKEIQRLNEEISKRFHDLECKD